MCWEVASWEVASRGEWPSGRLTTDELTNGLPKEGKPSCQKHPTNKSPPFCENGAASAPALRTCQSLWFVPVLLPPKPTHHQDSCFPP